MNQVRRSPPREPRSAEIVEKVIMRNWIIVLLATTPFAGACTASFPAPTQRMADAESAERSAASLQGFITSTRRRAVVLEAQARQRQEKRIRWI